MAESTFLFSVDLEDVRDMIPNGEMYKERVPLLTEQYLKFLDEHESKATFFVVGDVARKYPDLIREIHDKGHEVACHSDKHLHLTKMSKTEFKKDLEENILSIQRAGVTKIFGFRAPTFSLTNECEWAYDVMKECGIVYSSSVLPANNPLFGWPEFGASHKDMSGVLEIPITLSGLPGLNIPFCGGVYFRVLPFFLIKRLFKSKIRKGEPILNYLHPYDIDTDQEHFMHPHIDDSSFYNFLMYVNRGKVFKRLSNLFKIEGVKVCRYDEYYQKIISNAN